MAITLHGCGINASGELALGDTTQRAEFTAISSILPTYLAQSASSNTYAAIADGKLYIWGGWNTSSTPVQQGSATNWAKVAVGGDHFLATRTDGTLWVYGVNTLGQLGLNDYTDRLAGFVQLGSLTTWADVAAGNYFSLARKTDGTLWAWGTNGFGQLGIGSTTSQNIPTQIGSGTNWAKIDAAQNNGYAIKTDGTLWAWGDNSVGQIGDGSTTQRTAPVQVGSETTWSEIAVGYAHVIGLLAAGTAWSWGGNGSGQLGHGNTTELHSPTQIGSNSDWIAVGAGGERSIGTRTGGQVYFWGLLFTDQFGETILDHYESPTAVSGATGANVFSLLNSYEAIAGIESTAATGTAIAPITVSVVHKSGTAIAPIQINVRSSGAAVADIRVAVVEAFDTTEWTVGVTLDGVDIAARLTGAISIDAEEAAARTAEFAFIPASGELDPADLLSVQVIINLVRIINAVQVPTRIFTGVVEVANYDPVAGLIILSCHDDLKNKVSALSIEQIDTLTYNSLGLDYSPGALGAAAADRWDYAQARMECVSGALDAGVYGQLRVTPFAGSESWGTFDSTDIFDASLSIDLPQRSDIINKVVIDFEYRQHRCRERHAHIAWANTIIGGTDALASGYQSPSIDAVKSAVEGVDWEPISASYIYGYQYVSTSAPIGEVENGDWWYVGTQNACGSMVAELGQRHAQPFTEQYQITVTCASSAQTFGYREKELRGAVLTDFDPGEWERDWSITTPDATTAEVDYAGTQDRTVADEAIKTLCMMAERQILQSHRTCRVSFDIPCLPEIDLIHYAGIDTAAIDASGKVARIRHLIDIESGSAKTTLTLAVKGVGAVGGTTNTVLETPPPPPVWGPGPHDAEIWIDDTWVMDLPTLSRYVGSVTSHSWSETYNGYLVNAPEYLSVINFTLGITVAVQNPYYAVGWEFPQTGFKVTMPRVYENYRSAPAIKTITDERTCIVTASNPLTLTIGT
jgi:alpha-tubulin suppressor-like RCC1 family protein